MLAKRLDAPRETEQRAPDDAIDTFGGQLARILGGEILESAPPKEDEKPEEKKMQYDEAKTARCADANAGDAQPADG